MPPSLFEHGAPARSRPRHSEATAGRGRKGQENVAQALAWVGQRNRLSPVRAGETQAPISPRYSVPQKEHLRRFRFPLPYLAPLQGYDRWGRATQAKAWATFSWPFGPTAPVLPNAANAKPLVIPDRTPGPIRSPITDHRSRRSPHSPRSPISAIGYWLLAIGYRLWI